MPERGAVVNTVGTVSNLRAKSSLIWFSFRKAAHLELTGIIPRARSTQPVQSASGGKASSGVQHVTYRAERSRSLLCGIKNPGMAAHLEDAGGHTPGSASLVMSCGELYALLSRPIITSLLVYPARHQCSRQSPGGNDTPQIFCGLWSSIPQCNAFSGST